MSEPRSLFRTVMAAAGAIGLIASFGSAGIVGAQEQPVRGGTLDVIVQPEPPILILGLNQQAPTQLVAGKIYQGLLTYDFDL